MEENVTTENGRNPLVRCEPVANLGCVDFGTMELPETVEACRNCVCTKMGLRKPQKMTVKDQSQRTTTGLQIPFDSESIETRHHGNVMRLYLRRKIAVKFRRT